MVVERDRALCRVAPERLGEEAGVPEPLARKAAPVSAISYRGVNGEGKGERVTNDVIMCYDLELPSDFTPLPVVIDSFHSHSFTLLPIFSPNLFLFLTFSPLTIRTARSRSSSSCL